MPDREIVPRYGRGPSHQVQTGARKEEPEHEDRCGSLHHVQEGDGATRPGTDLRILARDDDQSFDNLDELDELDAETMLAGQTHVDGMIEGRALLERPLTDWFFVKDVVLKANASIVVDDLDASARLGLLEVGIVGHQRLCVLLCPSNSDLSHLHKGLKE